MPTTLFDPTKVNALADDVAHRLRRDRGLIAVEGPPGAGRDMLVERLARTLTDDDPVVVRLPAADSADAPIHTALQLAAAVGVEAVEHAEDGRAPLTERLKDVIRRLSSSQRALVIHVPDRFSTQGDASDDNQPTPRWFDTLVTMISDAQGIPCALVVPEQTTRQLGSARKFRPESLPAAESDRNALFASELWGDYAPYAAQLGAALAARSLCLGPLQIRLMVGLIALGTPAAEVLAAVESAGPTQLSPLVRRYVALLQTPRHATLRAAIRRLLLARAPLASHDALALAAPPDEHQPLLSRCLAYGESRLRVAPLVRASLLELLTPGPDEALAHKQIADHHRQSDGAFSAHEAASGSPAQLYHWLEKVHHLAHSGPHGAEDWSKQDLLDRQFLIDRARALSIYERDYHGASALYARCEELDAKDAYSIHYRGFNLDRLGDEPHEVERCFRSARDLNPSNLFYNSRLVTFLISQARYLEAEKSWQQACRNLTERDPSVVARHVTAHVVQAWLDAGEIRRARLAFDSLPFDDDVSRSMSPLRERLLDAEEAELLGAAVYPSHIDSASRWRAPRLIPAHLGRGLTHWYPGRVSVGDAPGEVHVVWAMPSADPSQRRAFKQIMPIEQWRKIGGECPLDEQSAYFELAEYESPEPPRVFMDPTPPRAMTATEDVHPLRYLLRESPPLVNGDRATA